MQGQGPFVPPQASHCESRHTSPLGQSVLVVHWTGEPASVCVGGMHRPPVQTVPIGQSPLVVHCCSQPFVVRICPAGQLVFPVQGFTGGGLTDPQP